MRGWSLVVGALIIFAGSVSIGLYGFGNYIRLNIDRFGFVHTYGDQLSISFGNTLVFFDKTGREAGSIDLSPFEIKMHGDYAFYQNGDLLVYNQVSPPGFFYQFTRYLRIRKLDELTSEGDEGFYRCRVKEKVCEKLQRLPVMRSTFRLARVPERDQFVLVDTPGFDLYLIDSNGAILAKSQNSALYFPNQVAFVAGELWLADTNNHRLVSLSHNQKTFARVKSGFKSIYNSSNKWPHQFAYDGNKLWVNIAQNNMKNGVITQFSMQGQKLGELDLANTSIKDPMAMHIWSEQLWLADFSVPIFKRFNLGGELLPNPESATLQQLTSVAESQRVKGVKIKIVGIIIFVTSLVLGFAEAFYLERKKTELNS